MWAQSELETGLDELGFGLLKHCYPPLSLGSACGPNCCIIFMLLLLDLKTLSMKTIICLLKFSNKKLNGLRSISFCGLPRVCSHELQYERTQRQMYAL